MPKDKQFSETNFLKSRYVEWLVTECAHKIVRLLTDGLVIYLQNVRIRIMQDGQLLISILLAFTLNEC